MSSEGIERLCEAIVERAVLDYRETVRTGPRSVNEFKISIPELERFFKSDWCATVLEILGGKLDGEKILHELERSPKPVRRGYRKIKAG